MAIADVFDALTSFRPYKQAWSFEDAVNYLQEKSGKEFDTKLVEIFINNIDEVTVIYNSFKDE